MEKTTKPTEKQISAKILNKSGYSHTAIGFIAEKIEHMNEQVFGSLKSDFTKSTKLPLFNRHGKIFHDTKQVYLKFGSNPLFDSYDGKKQKTGENDRFTVEHTTKNRVHCYKFSDSKKEYNVGVDMVNMFLAFRSGYNKISQKDIGIFSKIGLITNIFQGALNINKALSDPLTVNVMAETYYQKIHSRYKAFLLKFKNIELSDVFGENSFLTPLDFEQNDLSIIINCGNDRFLVTEKIASENKTLTIALLKPTSLKNEVKEYIKKDLPIQKLSNTDQESEFVAKIAYQHIASWYAVKNADKTVTRKM